MAGARIRVVLSPWRASHRASALSALLIGAALLPVAVATTTDPVADAAVGPLTSMPACMAATSSGGDWPSYGHDPSNTRNQPDEQEIGTAAAPSLKPKWVFSTGTDGDPGAINSTPIEDGGCVYVGTATGMVDALNADTGSLVWSTRVPFALAGGGGAIVGAPAISGNLVEVLVNDAGDGSTHGPYAAALDRSTGAIVWMSKPVDTYPASITNASAAIVNGILFFGYSAPEGDPHGQGGFALLDATTGQILDVTPTISRADQALGYAGGGIWSTPAFDPTTDFAYVGSGNPYSKTIEDAHTNAILKIDVNPARPTFGQIVASYKGNVDQYSQSLQFLSHTQLCAAEAQQAMNEAVCGQLDLDFGASPNLFRGPGGTLEVGELQKSGVYHVANASTMSPAWTAILGLSCTVCNFDSTAVDAGSVYAEGTPEGGLLALGLSNGGIRWAAPVLDPIHYQSISTAGGVVYTIDSYGFFDAFSASNGLPLLRRPLQLDTGVPMANLSSSGISIARNTVFVGATGQLGALTNGLSDATGVGGGNQPETGYVIAYKPTG